MLLTLGIMFILFIAAYSGAKRGLVLQLVMTIGYLLSFLVAMRNYTKIRGILELVVPYLHASLSDTFVLFPQEAGLHLDRVFYNGVSFIAILAVGWLLTRLLGGLLHFVTELPLLKQANIIGGAALNFIVNYVGIFLILFVLSTIPMKPVQKQFDSSKLAQLIVAETPSLSGQVYQWWSGGHTK